MERKFLPAQLKQSPEFIDKQDEITVALDKDTFYSIAEAKLKLMEFEGITDREV